MGGGIGRRGLRGGEVILNARENQPLLDVATRTGFIYLTDDAPREVVVGIGIAAPHNLRRSWHLTPDMFRKTLPYGAALATMNFLVTANPRGGSDGLPRTRRFADDPPRPREFARYLRILHPGTRLNRRPA